MNKGNEKASPSDMFTRNEYALLCSRQRYGMIRTAVIANGITTIYDSRRQAKRAIAKHKLTNYKMVNA